MESFGQIRQKLLRDPTPVILGKSQDAALRVPRKRPFRSHSRQSTFLMHPGDDGGPALKTHRCAIGIRCDFEPSCLTKLYEHPVARPDAPSLSSPLLARRECASVRIPLCLYSRRLTLAKASCEIPGQPAAGDRGKASHERFNPPFQGIEFTCHLATSSQSGRDRR